jgi:hypothetical protein
MKQFLGRLAIFSFLPLFATIAVISRLDGYTDEFYLRFTTNKKDSLIVGTSRAAQGLQPATLDNILERGDVFNYAFTVDISPFGPTYLESIKRKLNSNSRNGIHIVAVDPWSISSQTSDPDDESSFPERNLMLGKTKLVNINPNIFYLIQSYESPLRSLLTPPLNRSVFLHDDGWLEVTVPMDEKSAEERLTRRINDYKNHYLPKYRFSEVRWRYLMKTIDFLQEHGEVYLVRLPVHRKMHEIEEAFMPDFESHIYSLGKPFKTFAKESDNYEYVDGNHLVTWSGREVSRAVAEWIKARCGSCRSWREPRLAIAPK